MRFPLKLLARVLALIWAGWWLVFFVVESWATHTPVTMAMPWVGLGVLFAVLALVPWRWSLTGGILLAVVGVAAAVMYAVWSPPQLPVASRVLTTLLFGTPPLGAGILFAMDQNR